MDVPLFEDSDAYIRCVVEMLSILCNTFNDKTFDLDAEVCVNAIHWSAAPDISKIEFATGIELELIEVKKC